MATEKPLFTQEAEDLIFNTARAQVVSTVLWRGSGRPGPDFAKELGELAEVPVLGTFVSFKTKGQLRSCMGWMNDGVSLAEALRASAISVHVPKYGTFRSIQQTSFSHDSLSSFTL